MMIKYLFLIKIFQAVTAVMMTMTMMTTIMMTMTMIKGGA